MALTILEVLQNCQYNINNITTVFAVQLAKEQINNALILLEKGYDLYDSFTDINNKYSDLNDAPMKIKQKQ